MSWIKTIPYSQATGKLKSIYDRIKEPGGQIDNILTVHSLRPHTLIGHMSLYINTLHHSRNELPNWFLELLGTYTSFINDCTYCYLHHYEGMRRFLADDNRAMALKRGIETDSLSELLTPKELGFLRYGEQLTKRPEVLSHLDINRLRQLGASDGEILEVNQVISYFNYANRTVMGLGVTTDNEVLGLSPKNKEGSDSWSHE